MAVETSKKLRNQVIYSIFVRNYSEEGTFEKVREDLDRIKNLGVDILWLMPIQPSGKKNRKGSLGSPYAISDYRAINPEFGTMEDFQRLVEDIHAKGMRVIIDVVYNHTSPDSVLSMEHPEWFYHKPDGSFGNRIGDWWDVIDLDYRNPGLWDYQIETLKMWADYVDGFRCDVSPMVPLDFWKRARAEVAESHPGRTFTWLAESVEPGMIQANRNRGIETSSDSESYQAFDLCYDYDIYPEFIDAITGNDTLQHYAEAINRQEAIYPGNYGKARFLENHDRARGAFLVPDERLLRNWTAFTYFQKGCVLLYNGQEKGEVHTPSLFDKDTIKWRNPNRPGLDLTELMQRLYQIKQEEVFTDSTYHVREAREGVMTAKHLENKSDFEPGARRCAYGVFCLGNEAHNPCSVDVRADQIADGIYKNEIDGREIEVRDGMIALYGEPVVLFL